MGERDRYFWFGLGDCSGLFLGALLLLVDDGVPPGMALGGFGAGLELLILLFLESLQLFLESLHIYLLMLFGSLCQAFICGIYVL